MASLLITRFSAMGDVAMTVPVVASLARQYPDLQITVVSRPYARAFFSRLGGNVSFVGIDLKKDYKGIGGLLCLYGELKRRGFDHVADFHDVLRTKVLRLLFMLSGVRTAHIDKHRSEKKALVRRGAAAYHQLPSSFDNYAEVLRKLGFPVTLDFDSIYGTGKGDFTIIADRIEARKEGERWYGIAPFAAHRGKIYPEGKMLQVVDNLLASDPRCRLFFFGNGEKEYEVISHLIKNNRRCLNASKTLHGLPEELVLISHLDAMLSMDSANMHLASLTGTRVVSIWGATHPYAGFLGWRQRTKDTIQTDKRCRPCSIYGNRKCTFGNYPCMDLDPEIVIKTLQNK